MERRKEHRLSVTEQITLMVLDAPGSHPIEGCVLDVSRSGLQVRLPNPLPCDTVIKIDAGDEQILGRVCYCQADGGAYRVGIQLTVPLPSLAG